MLDFVSAACCKRRQHVSQLVSATFYPAYLTCLIMLYPQHSTYQGLSDGTTYLPKERFPHLTGRRGGTGRSRGSHANLTSSTAALARVSTISDDVQ
jgi:hypothetical protein